MIILLFGLRGKGIRDSATSETRALPLFSSLVLIKFVNNCVIKQVEEHAIMITRLEASTPIPS